MANNIYSELFEQLSIPERLEPENIAKMLEENAGFSKKRSGIVISEAVTSAKTKTKAEKKSHSATYRAIMSVAACAVLVLGLVRYAGVDNSTALTEENHGGTFAEDYDELHKTFQKYYVNEEEKKTLDSAMAEIEHSYNENENNNITDNVVPEKEPEVISDNEDDIEMPPVQSQPEENDVAAPDVTEQEAPTVIPDEIPEENVTVEDETQEFVLPDMSGFGTNDNVRTFGGRIFITEQDSITLIKSSNGELSLSSIISPACAANEAKSLVDFYVSGDRLAVVYAVETYEPVSAPAQDAAGDKTVLDELMDDVYTEAVETFTRHSVEIAVYDISGDAAVAVTTDVQSGRFVDIKQSGNALYVVTSYDDYRLSPIVGVGDLDSYVPSYSLNGEKFYIEANSILIPSYMSSTDYTIISGIDLSSSGEGVSIQALLGYEGRMLMTDDAVYVLGYENVNGTDKTTVQMFSLANGIVSLGSYASTEGVALSGKGIAQINGAVVVSTLRNTESGYITTVTVFDSMLNIVSKCDLPAILTDADYDESVLTLSSSKETYSLDLVNPAVPEVVTYAKKTDFAQGLEAFGGGYIALTDVNGVLTLSNIAFDENGRAYTICDTAVYEGTYTSKALADNSVMYVDNVNSIVGVPYGYYDGYDFCYRYVLYKLEGKEFRFIGSLESHEMDTAFEYGKATMQDGVLYIFAKGRVYSALANADTLALLDSVNLIESTYSGHIAF